MEDLKEIINFISLDSRLDLKAVAVMQILGLTGSADGRKLIISLPEIIERLILLCNDSSDSVAKDACLSLVNISAEENGVHSLLNAFETSKDHSASDAKNGDIVAVLLNKITDPESPLADPACMLLCNLSRSSAYCDKVYERIENSGITIEKLIHIFCNISYNKKGAKLDYLGPLFSNLTQLAPVRRSVMNRDRIVLQRLLPFTEYEGSSIRRGGVIGTLRNCCFDLEDHEWLLSEKVDILPRLLLPLAGPEEFDDEDNEKLPLELQYLPEDKKREPDPDIRMLILEAVTKLCAVRSNRIKIRDQNTYIILRELHKWEKDRKALLACENLVDLLIRTEDEIGEENLHQVDVPEDLTEKFHKMDEEFLKDS